MPNFNRTSPRLATRRIHRAVTLLFRAGRQLDAAGCAMPDPYHSDRLRHLAVGLRDFSLPLSRLAARLDNGGAR